MGSAGSSEANGSASAEGLGAFSAAAAGGGVHSRGTLLQRIDSILPLARFSRRVPRKSVQIVASGGGKVDINKQGLNSIDDPVVQQNLMGRSRYMAKKDWKDAAGRKGKVRS